MARCIPLLALVAVAAAQPLGDVPTVFRAKVDTAALCTETGPVEGDPCTFCKCFNKEECIPVHAECDWDRREKEHLLQGCQPVYESGICCPKVVCPAGTAHAAALPAQSGDAARPTAATGVTTTNTTTVSQQEPEVTEERKAAGELDATADELLPADPSPQSAVAPAEPEISLSGSTPHEAELLQAEIAAATEAELLQAEIAAATGAFLSEAGSSGDGVDSLAADFLGSEGSGEGTEFLEMMIDTGLLQDSNGLLDTEMLLGPDLLGGGGELLASPALLGSMANMQLSETGELLEGSGVGDGDGGALSGLSL